MKFWMPKLFHLAWVVMMGCLALGQAAAGVVPLSENGLATLAPMLEKIAPAVVNIAVLSRSPEGWNGGQKWRISPSPQFSAALHLFSCPAQRARMGGRGFV
ncbi:MAG: hypothetical protein ABL878_07820 [Burkholderiales bacterium]